MADEQADGPEEEGPPQIVVPVKVGLLTRLRNYFLTGIIITAPIGITVGLTVLVIEWVDEQVTPLIPEQYNPETYLPFGIPGLGIFIVVVFLTFVGFLTATFLGRLLIRIGERMVNRMPIVRTVYSALKQIFETVMRHSSQSFRQVVLVEYPKEGIWALAFVTADGKGETPRLVGEDLVNVFLPTTPNPTSGFLLLVPRKDLIFLDMTVEEAAKMIISAGVIMPPDRTAPKGPVLVPETTPELEQQPAE